MPTCRSRGVLESGPKLAARWKERSAASDIYITYCAPIGQRRKAHTLTNPLSLSLSLSLSHLYRDRATRDCYLNDPAIPPLPFRSNPAPFSCANNSSKERPKISSSCLVDGQRRWSRRLWPGTRAQAREQPLCGIHAPARGRSPRAQRVALSRRAWSGGWARGLLRARHFDHATPPRPAVP